MTHTESSTQTLSQVQDNIENCKELLKKLSATCCLQDRSSSLNDLANELVALAQETFGAAQNLDRADDCIGIVTRLGGRIGALHVSCCTPVKEPLYQKLLMALNAIHTDLWRMKGIVH